MPRRFDHVQLLALLWTLGLCLTLWLPGDSMPGLESSFLSSLPRGADKVFHGGLFFFETLWLVRAFRRRAGIRRPLRTALFAVVFLALLTEVVQGWIPGRSRELADLGANFVGAALGALVSWRASAEATPPSDE